MLPLPDLDFEEVLYWDDKPGLTVIRFSIGGKPHQAQIGWADDTKVWEEHDDPHSGQQADIVVATMYWMTDED